MTATTSKPGTAIITGASSGIGAEFARRLAARDHDLILIARRADRLLTLASELARKHRISVQPLPADLSRPDELERLQQELARLEKVDLLVNNAGFGVRGLFGDVAPEKHRDMVEVHVMASVLLTRAVLPGMIARKRGAIINVSSLAGFLPLPESTIYSSTKAFLIFFSRSLDAQLRGGGVRVQALCPGYTYTEFHDTEEFKDFSRSEIPRWLWLPVERVVDESLEALESGKTVCVPGRRYRVIAAFARSRAAALLLRAPGLIRWLRPYPGGAKK
jgi:short-subunit dehydrogenase